MSTPDPAITDNHCEKFVVEVSSELSQEVMRSRWQEVNLLLRLSMMPGLQMQLEATLSQLCELARQIVGFDRALVYYWNHADERFQLRRCVGVTDEVKAGSPGLILNRWCVRHGKPLRMATGGHPDADATLGLMQAESVAVVPVLVNNRVMGTLQLYSESPTAFADEDIQLLWLLVRVAENLLAREQASEGLLHFAFTDHLTGLRTRGYFEQQLELEIKRTERNQQRFALLMLDIDHFKQLNDTYGHHAGDAVLRQVARILTTDMREVDTVARYGGEEFVIVLPETTEEEGHAVAQRIRKAVEQADLGASLRNATGGRVLGKRLSISIGLAVFDPKVKVKSKRELVQSADSALYVAKSQGRNRVVKHREMREVS